MKGQPQLATLLCLQASWFSIQPEASSQNRQRQQPCQPESGHEEQHPRRTYPHSICQQQQQQQSDLPLLCDGNECLFFPSVHDRPHDPAQHRA